MTEETKVVAETKVTDFNDQAAQSGLNAVRQTVDKVLKGAAAGRSTPELERAEERTIIHVDAPWPAPLLPGTRRTPDIPATLLPGWLGDMAAAVSASTQTPPALAVLIGLSVLATALQRRYEVSPYGDDYREPLALFLAVLLGSGNRKSAVFSAMTAPIVLAEKRARDRARSRIARNESERAVSRKRIERLLADSAKAKEDGDRENVRAAIQAEEEAMPEELHAPRLFTTNATAEVLQALLVEQRGRIAILADEGDVLAVLGGLYSGGKAALDVLLMGHAGTPIRVDRAGRTAHIDRPALTIGLAIQPGTMAELAGSKRFRDSGLLARFLVAMPASNLGRRDVRLRLPIPSEVREVYQARLLRLLDGEDAAAEPSRVLTFTDAARDMWLDLAEHVEHGLGPGGTFDAIADWAGKLPGAVARIAGLLELADSGLEAREVHQDTMARAIELGHLLTAHAQAMFGLLGADAIDVDAQAVVAWVRAQQLREFTAQQCRMAMRGRFSTTQRLDAAMHRLISEHVLRETSRPNPNARPSRLFVVNPALFVQEIQ